MPRPRVTPKAQAAPPSGGQARTLLIVAFGAFMLVAGLGAVGMGVLFWRQAPADADADADADGNEADSAGSGLGDITVSMDSADSRLRWIKLLDSDGEEMARGRPDAEVSLPLGVYTLQASVVGRPVAEAEFDLVSDVSWSCTPEDEGSVVCEAEDRILLLTPAD